MSSREPTLRELLQDPEDEEALREIVRQELQRTQDQPRSGIVLPDGYTFYEEERRGAPDRTAELVEVVQSPDGRSIITTTIRRSQPKSPRAR